MDQNIEGRAAIQNLRKLINLMIENNTHTCCEHHKVFSEYFSASMRKYEQQLIENFQCSTPIDEDQRILDVSVALIHASAMALANQISMISKPKLRDALAVKVMETIESVNPDLVQEPEIKPVAVIAGSDPADALRRLFGELGLMAAPAPGKKLH